MVSLNEPRADGARYRIGRGAEAGDVVLPKPRVPELHVTEPDVTDGPGLWRLARDTQVLDLNSGYAYLLWCREFAPTSAVAKVGGVVVGFVTGFQRPAAPDTVMVWQIAVDAAYRGRKLAQRMLHAIIDRPSLRGLRWLHTTVSPDNTASIRLFNALARDRGTGIERRELFVPDDFPVDEPGEHDAEDLYVIGPFRPAATTSNDLHRSPQ